LALATAAPPWSLTAPTMEPLWTWLNKAEAKRNTTEYTRSIYRKDITLGA
jgi:hypothetical protein